MTFLTSDQQARHTSAPEVSPDLLVDAWRGLVPAAPPRHEPMRADEPRRTGKSVSTLEAVYFDFNRYDIRTVQDH